VSTELNDRDAYRWEESLPHILWRAQNAVHRRAQESLDELGITVTQLGLAVHLHHLGALSASDLARGFHITPQSVTTALTRLDQLGWIERHPHPVHKRVILNVLTDAGVEGVRMGSAKMSDVNSQVAAALSDGDSGLLIGELRRIIIQFDGDDQPVGTLWPVRGA
jgi:DNA-binding MarR family transcriptional regulator